LKARELEEADHDAMVAILDKIEEAATAIAAEASADVRIEKGRGVKFPYLTLRAFGFHQPEEDESGLAECEIS
jgi:hypothetical protein